MNLVINNNIEMTSVSLGQKGNPRIDAIREKIAHVKHHVHAMSNEEIHGRVEEIFHDLKGLTPTDFIGEFGNVRTYGMVGLWNLSKAELRDIQSTQDVQQSLMNLEEGVENLSVVWSNFFTTILAADAKAVQTAANATYANPGDKAAAVNAATNTYNQHSTEMGTFSTNYSSENNLLSNGVTNAGQNLSTDGATIQQVTMKLMDSLSQLLGNI